MGVDGVGVGAESDIAPLPPPLRTLFVELNSQLGIPGSCCNPLTALAPQQRGCIALREFLSLLTVGVRWKVVQRADVESRVEENSMWKGCRGYRRYGKAEACVHWVSWVWGWEWVEVRRGGITGSGVAG